MIANTSFRVLTRYTNTKHKGECPWAFNFDPKTTTTSAQNNSLDGDFMLTVTLDASQPDKNITQKAELMFMEKGNHYYLNSTQIMYSENAFPNGEGDEVKTISALNMTAYPTEKVKYLILAFKLMKLFRIQVMLANMPPRFSSILRINIHMV